MADCLIEDEPCTYMCGNSLGLLAKRSRKLVEEELEVWATRCGLGLPSAKALLTESLRL